MEIQAPSLGWQKSGYMHITAQASLHLNKDGMNNLGLINDYFFD